jgi:hypothetical protein
LTAATARYVRSRFLTPARPRPLVKLIRPHQYDIGGKDASCHAGHRHPLHVGCVKSSDARKPETDCHSEFKPIHEQLYNSDHIYFSSSSPYLSRCYYVIWEIKITYVLLYALQNRYYTNTSHYRTVCKYCLIFLIRSKNGSMVSLFTIFLGTSKTSIKFPAWTTKRNRNGVGKLPKFLISAFLGICCKNVLSVAEWCKLKKSPVIRIEIICKVPVGMIIILWCTNHVIRAQNRPGKNWH